MKAAPNEIAAARRAADIAKALYMNNPRVTLIDVGEKIEDGERTGRLAVRIHVVSKPIDQPDATLREQFGAAFIDKSRIPYETDIIEATYAMHQLTTGLADPRATANNPLVGGISVSSEYLVGYGTLGCLVLDRSTRRPMILSNWHVLVAMFFPSTGAGVVQPGLGDGGWGRRVGTVARHGIYGGHDAAVAMLDGTRTWSPELVGLARMPGIGAPQVGDLVEKSGRGSGLTSGIIEGVDGAYPFRYPGGMLEIRDIFRVASIDGAEVSRGGDSGSIYCRTGTHEGVGLHFAGGDQPEVGLGMSLPAVLETLDAELPV